MAQTYQVLCPPCTSNYIPPVVILLDDQASASRLGHLLRSGTISRSSPADGCLDVPGCSPETFHSNSVYKL